MPHGINSRVLTKQNPFTNESAHAVGKRLLFILIARRHASPSVLNTFPRDLANVNEWKIMFDPSVVKYHEVIYFRSKN